MKKNISLLFIILLISSCGINNNDNTEPKVENEIKMNELNNNAKNNIKVEKNNEKEIILDNKNLEKENGEKDDGNIDITIKKEQNENNEILNEEEENKLIEDAIKEIDNIIKEIETDV